MYMYVRKMFKDTEKNGSVFIYISLAKKEPENNEWNEGTRRRMNLQA